MDTCIKYGWMDGFKYYSTSQTITNLSGYMTYVSWPNENVLQGVNGGYDYRLAPCAAGESVLYWGDSKTCEAGTWSIDPYPTMMNRAKVTGKINTSATGYKTATLYSPYIN
ncbi:hypothetical protein [Streptomyces sp. NPDC057675]|uniref:hypothetical protein n=1 Tax=Streptomyces sp. NPDC057675 TaxID=3346204 RepID=UPI0036A87E86